MIIKDDRFYHVDGKHYPRVTWILGNGYPIGDALLKWYGAHGYEMAKQLMNKAGDLGTNVHHAIERRLQGSKLTPDAFSIPEWRKLTGFKNWRDTWKYDEMVSLETRVVYEGDDIRYAGTFDALAKKDGELHILDWKSGSQQPKHWLQAAAYAHAYEVEHGVEIDFTGVLYLNDTRMKYTFKERNRSQWQKDYKDFVKVWRVAATIVNFDNPKNEELPDEI